MDEMVVSCNLLPNPGIVQQAVLAEQLGYARVCAADSPPLYGDVWASLALIET
jgi:hypothetical protein